MHNGNLIGYLFLSFVRWGQRSLSLRANFSVHWDNALMNPLLDVLCLMRSFYSCWRGHKLPSLVWAEVIFCLILWVVLSPAFSSFCTCMTRSVHRWRHHRSLDLCVCLSVSLSLALALSFWVLFVVNSSHFGLPGLQIQSLLNSGSVLGSALVPLPVQQPGNALPTVLWENHAVQLIGFPLFSDHCSVLPIVQFLKTLVLHVLFNFF